MRVSSKITIIAAILLISVIGIGGFWIYRHYDTSTDGPTISSENVIKYELQTHEYFSDAPQTTQYHINSESELNNFYALYSNQLKANVEYLKDNDLFIKVESASSGSIKHKLSIVNFDNNTVNFIISTEKPEIGTDDMAFWYFVAVIPRDKLNNLNLDDWKKPSEILKQS